MTAKQPGVDKDRRQFLQGSAIAGASAVIAGGLPGVAAASPETEPAEEAVTEGYRLTEHVRAYYKAAAS